MPSEKSEAEKKAAQYRTMLIELINCLGYDTVVRDGSTNPPVSEKHLQEMFLSAKEVVKAYVEEDKELRKLHAQVKTLKAAIHVLSE